MTDAPPSRELNLHEEIQQTLSKDQTDREEMELEGDKIDEGKKIDNTPLIIARGAGVGLVLRITKQVEKDELLSEIRSFLQTRKQFLEGNEVVLEFQEARPSYEVEREIEQLMKAEFKVGIQNILVRSTIRVQPQFSKVQAPGLSGEVEVLAEPEYSAGTDIILDDSDANRLESVERRTEALPQFAADSMLFDKADSRVVYATLRSGQKIQSEHTVVIVGDVNSGAEVISGGDVIVLGALRGIAHAGAFDESGGGRIIFALNLQATQLRIGTVITRGVSEHSKVPEVARVEGGTIMVEAYHPRTVFHKGPRVVK